MWAVEDHTNTRNGNRVGWLALTYDGEEIGQFHPFARNRSDAEAQWVIAQAHKIAECMNNAGVP